MSEMMGRLVEAYCKMHMHCPPPEGLTQSQRTYVEAFCRVILRVMREPTSAMLRRGEATIFEHTARAEEWQMDATKEGYQAMIDAV